MFLDSGLDKLCRYQALKVKWREDIENVVKNKQQWLRKEHFVEKHTFVLKQLIDQHGNLISGFT
jgi:hypothetical protein